MTESVTVVQETVVEEYVGPVLLRQAREAAGLHVEILASAMKVPVHKLVALEEGRFDELPDIVFARALASSVCRHLGIDPRPILEQLPSPPNTVGDVPRPISRPFRASTVDLGGSTGSGGLKKAAWIAVVLVVAAVVLLLLPDDMPWSHWFGAGAPASTVAEPLGEGAGVVEPVSPSVPAAPMPTPGDTSPATGGPAASSGSADGAVVPVLQAADALQVADAGGAPAAADTAATDAAGGETSLLVLTARGESWVQVTNGRGEVVIQRVMRAGDTHDFSSTPPYTVVVGRADQMEVAVRGQPFDLGAVTRANVARFEVK